MRGRQVGRVNQQSKGETPMVSGVLQRAAVRAVAEKEVEMEATEDVESGTLRESRFRHDFSQVGIDRGSQVVQQINTPASAQLTQGQLVQRREEQSQTLQAKLEINPPQPSPKDPSPEAQLTTDSDRAIQGKGGKTKANPATAEAQRPNHTGLSDGLKSGIEALSGISLDGVKVHYNSSQPAQLNALAYTQGTDIYVAPGQERHLPHEAWHVVQQKQGRVKPTRQMKGKVNVNDDADLEKEADVMGTKAAHQPKLADVPEQDKESTTLKPASPVSQLFTAPPPNPPLAGIRNGTLNGAGAPVESHVTTIHGAPNDLVGSVPGAIILGWQHIRTVQATGAWVRFHLVNQQVGGLGNQSNLVPTSQATNHNPAWRSFERRIQNLANAQTGIHVTVDVAYPAAVPGAGPGTLAAVSHFYPTNISARVYVWNPITGYVLDPNQPNFAPFPLQPPSVAGVTDLTQQTAVWVRSTLMGGLLTSSQASSFHAALQNGTAGNYRDNSNEPTPEMQLLDALETVGTVDCIEEGEEGSSTGTSKKRKKGKQILGAPLPPSSRIQVLNGAYILP